MARDRRGSRGASLARTCSSALITAFSTERRLWGWNAGFDQRFAAPFCAIRAFSRARPIFELCALKKKKARAANRRLLIFFGPVHAPSGLRIWRSRRRGAGGSSPDRRLGDPRGVPWEPRTRPQTRLRWKDGRIRVSSSRARDVWRTAKKYQSRPKNRPRAERIVEARTAPRACPGAQPGAHAGLRIDIFLVVLEDEERRVVFTQKPRNHRAPVPLGFPSFRAS